MRLIPPGANRNNRPPSPSAAPSLSPARLLTELARLATSLRKASVLAGSAAYGVSELWSWTEGLDRKPKEAKAFYATIAVATLGGAALTFSPLDPVRALYWSAVVNGVLAAPLMAVMMVIAVNPRAMGRLTLPWPMIVGGWIATAAMALATIGFLVL